jgi:hypothetical protein
MYFIEIKYDFFLHYDPIIFKKIIFKLIYLSVFLDIRRLKIKFLK